MATGGNRAAGFTIVETLIVLAVSGALATSFLVLVSGRQNKTEFQVAANSMKQQIEQLINETRNGFYPKTDSFTCVTSGPKIVTDTSTPKQQGSNDKCLFLGKVVVFGFDSYGANPESYIVYPMIGRRYNKAAPTVEATSFSEAQPTALALGTPSEITVDTSSINSTKYGMSLQHADYIIKGNPTPQVNSKNGTYAVLAFLDDLKNTSTGSQTSATQSLDLYELDLASSDWPPATLPGTKQLVDRINRGIDDTQTVSAARLCFASGSTDQSALITITGQGQLAVSLQVYGGKTCGV